MGALMEYFLTKRKAVRGHARPQRHALCEGCHVVCTAQRVSVVVSTSGDTGPAAIAALKSRAGIDCYVLFPSGARSRRAQWSGFPADEADALFAQAWSPRGRRSR